MKRPKGFRYVEGDIEPPVTPPARDDAGESRSSDDPDSTGESQVVDDPHLTEASRAVDEFGQTHEPQGSALEPFDAYSATRSDSGIDGGPDLEETQELGDVERGSRQAWFRRSPADEDILYREAKQAFRRAERERKRRERTERHRFTQQQRLARRRLLIILSAVSVLVLAIGVGTFTPLMSVRSVDVRGTDRIDVSAVTDALHDVEGKPLALVTDEDVRARLATLTLIESFAVEKIPPSTLRVVVQERQPVVAIPHGDHVLLIDPAGIRVDQVPRDERPEGIPLAPGVGTEFDSNEFTALSTALRSMPEGMRHLVGEVAAETPQQITLTLTDGLPVVWGDATQNTRKAMVLESMLAALSEVPLRSVDVSSPDAPVYVPA